MSLVPALPTDQCALDHDHRLPVFVVVDDAEVGWVGRARARVWCTQDEADAFAERLGATL